MSFVVLDTETTGTDPYSDEVLSVAVLDADGSVLLDSLVRPSATALRRGWRGAQEVHGIRPADVRAPGVPTLAELAPRLADAVRGRVVVIYNKAFDGVLLLGLLGEATELRCCMLAYSEHEEVREWNDYHRNWRWQSLADAARHVGHQWQDEQHTALADCWATRDVWAWLTDPVERLRLDAEQAYREVFERKERATAKRHAARNQAWEQQHLPALGISGYSIDSIGLKVGEFSAQASADAFMRHLEGTTATAWNRYGPQLLALPRYFFLVDDVPTGLTISSEVHLLPAAGRIKPVGLRVYGRAGTPPHEWNNAVALYKTRSLRRGVHYVPLLPGYEPWPEGHYSLSTLKKQFKLTKEQLASIRPAYLRVVKSGKYYENQYLLYPYVPTAK